MSEATCPYCDKEVEIYKSFIFTTYISINHFTKKAPCLNGEPHKDEPTIAYPKNFTKMECAYCGRKRELDKPERNALGRAETYDELKEALTKAKTQLQAQQEMRVLFNKEPE